jgi:hypothetical protein
MGRSNHAVPNAFSRAFCSASLALLLAFGAACSGKDPYSPGTKLGTFHVTAKLTQTTCGATPDPWEFDVRLNHDGSTLYWIQGGAPVEGRVDTAAKAQLKSETTHSVRAADPRTKMAACSIARADILDVVLSSADTKPTTDPGTTASFAGGLVYSFTPTEGSDCVDQLTSTGGGFDALPCEVRYDIAGTFKSAPP